MYFGTCINARVFKPNELILCNQNVHSIAWGTIESTCDDAILQLLQTLTKNPVPYSRAEFMAFLNQHLKEPLSLCYFAFQTDYNVLSFSFYGEKTLRFKLGSDKDLFYQMDIASSPTYHLPPSLILEALDIGLNLLPVTTREKLEQTIQLLDLFSPGALTPVSG